MKMIKAVIFDWAGTIIDHGSIAPVEVFIDVFRKFGIELTLEEVRAPMGLGKKDHVRALMNLEKVKNSWKNETNTFPDELVVERVYNILAPSLKETVRNYAHAIPGVQELFLTLRQSEIKIGSTTGYSKEIMEEIIPFAKDQEILPDAIVPSDCVPSGRPFPYMIYRNAILLEVFPLSQMVKVGDTVADIKEGLNAGMWTVGFTRCGNEVGLTESELSGISREELFERFYIAEKKLVNAGAHYICQGPEDLLPILDDINRSLSMGQKP